MSMSCLFLTTLYLKVLPRLHVGELLSCFVSRGYISLNETDLNTITDYGIYSGANLQLVINGPTGAPTAIYVMLVYGYSGNARLVQTVITKGYIRSRTYFNEWSEWA